MSYLKNTHRLIKRKKAGAYKRTMPCMDFRPPIIKAGYKALRLFPH